MVKVTFSGEDHGNAVTVAGRDHVVIADGTSRLNNGADTVLVCHFDGIRHREKSIAGKNGAARFITGLAAGNLHGIHARHLPRPESNRPAPLRQHNGIGFDHLHAFEGKNQICQLSGLELGLRHHLDFLFEGVHGRSHRGILVLHQQHPVLHETVIQSCRRT